MDKSRPWGHYQKVVAFAELVLSEPVLIVRHNEQRGWGVRPTPPSLPLPRSVTEEEVVGLGRQRAERAVRLPAEEDERSVDRLSRGNRSLDVELAIADALRDPKAGDLAVHLHVDGHPEVRTDGSVHRLDQTEVAAVLPVLRTHLGIGVNEEPNDGVILDSRHCSTPKELDGIDRPLVVGRIAE